MLDQGGQIRMVKDALFRALEAVASRNGIPLPARQGIPSSDVQKAVAALVGRDSRGIEESAGWSPGGELVLTISSAWPEDKRHLVQAVVEFVRLHGAPDVYASLAQHILIVRYDQTGWAWKKGALEAVHQALSKSPDEPGDLSLELDDLLRQGVSPLQIGEVKIVLLPTRPGKPDVKAISLPAMASGLGSAKIPELTDALMQSEFNNFSASENGGITTFVIRQS